MFIVKDYSDGGPRFTHHPSGATITTRSFEARDAWLREYIGLVVFSADNGLPAWIVTMQDEGQIYLRDAYIH